MTTHGQTVLPEYCPHALRRLLERFHRRWLVDRCLGVMLAAFGAALAIFLVGVAVDRIAEVSPYLRCVAPLLMAAALLAGLVGIVVLVLRAPEHPERLASRLDARIEGSHNTLHSAVNFLVRVHRRERPGHDFLVDNTVVAAERMAGAVDLRAVCPFRSATRFGLPVLGLAGLLIVLALVPAMDMGTLWARFLDPFGNHPRPSRTRIRCDLPLVSKLEAGSDLTINVALTRRIPRSPSCQVIVHYDAPDMPDERIALQPLPKASFRGQIRNVRANFSFRIEAGHARTARHDVLVLYPPRIVTMQARYTPPRYSRLKERNEIVRNRQIRGLVDTVVSLSFISDAPAREAFVTLETQRAGDGGPGRGGLTETPDGGRTALGLFFAQESKRKGEDKPKVVRKRVPIRWDDEWTLDGLGLHMPPPWAPRFRRGRFEIRLDRSAVMRVNLQGEGGVWNRFDPSYKIQVIPDNPPTINIINLPDDMTVRQDDVLRVRYHASDDLGIAALQYRVRKRERHQDQEEYIPLPKFGEKKLEDEIAIPVRELAPESRYVWAGGYQDSAFDLLLGASDLKGQTGFSRRIHLNVLFETYDRSMNELITVLNDRGAALDAYRRTLRGAANALTILRDSLGEKGKWQKQHQERFGRAFGPLRRARAFTSWEAYQRARAYRLSFYPYRAQQATDQLFSYVPVVFDQFTGLGGIAKSTDPWKRLGDIIDVLKAQGELADAFALACDSTTRMLRADVLMYLVELSRRELAGFSGTQGTSDRGGDEFVDLFKGRLNARIAQIVKLADALGLNDLGSKEAAAFDALKAAKQQDDLKAVARALDGVRAALMVNDKIVRDANAPLAALVKKYDDAWLVAQGKRQQTPLAPAASWWLENLELAWDRSITNEPRMAARALGLLASRAPAVDPARLMAELAASRAFSQFYAAIEHVNQAWQEGRNLVDGADVGRLKPGEAQTERAWVRFRDAALVLADKSEQGGFAALDEPLRTALARIVPYRDVLVRWDLDAILTGPADRRRLDALMARIGQLRERLLDAARPPHPDAAALLADGCKRLADLFDIERADAIRHIALLKEEAARPAPPRDLPANQKPPTVANPNYGIAKEQRILEYAGMYRKLLDLYEFDRVTGPGLTPEVARQYAAMVEYLWWLQLEIVNQFGRYHGGSVVRLHNDTPRDYLNRMKNYPDELALAAAGFRHLAAQAGKPSPIVDNMVKTAGCKVQLAYEDKVYRTYLDAMAELAKPVAPADLKAGLVRLYGRPVTGAFMADRIVLPLRGVLDVLAAETPSPERVSAFHDNLRSVLAVIAILPEKPDEMDELAALLKPLEKAAGAAVRAMPEEKRRDLVDAVRKVLEVLTPKVQLPEIVTRSSRRMEIEARLNDSAAQSRERTHRLWQEESARQMRYYERERVGALLKLALDGRLDGARRRPILQFAHCRIAARKSAGVQREAGGTLDVKIQGIEYDLLAMPKHLYNELLRANNESYPKQFKDPGLDYIRRLLEDARR